MPLYYFRNLNLLLTIKHAAIYTVKDTLKSKNSLFILQQYDIYYSLEGL